jgi:hypothetical protein
MGIMISGFHAFEKMSLQSGRNPFSGRHGCQGSAFSGLNDEMVANQLICKVSEIKILGKLDIWWLPDFLLNEA